MVIPVYILPVMAGIFFSAGQENADACSSIGTRWRDCTKKENGAGNSG